MAWCLIRVARPWIYIDRDGAAGRDCRPVVEAVLEFAQLIRPEQPKDPASTRARISHLAEVHDRGREHVLAMAVPERQAQVQTGIQMPGPAARARGDLYQQEVLLRIDAHQAGLAMHPLPVDPIVDRDRSAALGRLTEGSPVTTVVADQEGLAQESTPLRLLAGWL